jgi:NitT/TauT family transport system substrate-binding protein
MEHSRKRAVRLLAIGFLLVAMAACGSGTAPRADAPGGTRAQPGSAAETRTASPEAAGTGQPASAAPAGAYRPTPLNPPVHLKVGAQLSISDAGIFIAQDMGYFRDEGLEVEIEKFQTGVEQIAPLGAGQLDVGTGALAAALFNAVGRDVPLRIVADKGSTPSAEWDFSALMVRRDLVESGRVKDYGDLKGLTISTTARGNSPEVDVAVALAKAGLTFDDINYTPLSFPDMITAFSNKGIDAAIVIEPYLSSIEELGTAVRWRGTVDFYGNQQVAVVMYGPDLVERRPEVGRRFMVAYVRALRAYNDAFGPKGHGRDEVIRILIANTPIKDPATYEKMRPAGLNPDGRVTLDSMRNDLAYYERTGQVTARVDLARAVDNQFVEYAVQQLGPYRP